MTQAALNLPVPLEFRQGNRWHLESVCGRYTVSKAFIQGMPIYTAWRRSEKQGGMPKHLGNKPDPDDAKELCRKDAEG